MDMNNILFIRQEMYYLTELYYIRFEAAISLDDLEKRNSTTRMKLNKFYANGYNEDNT